ncbi:MAG: hypothetical protein AAFO07_21140 [Bacteroidota bacterium]
MFDLYFAIGDTHFFDRNSTLPPVEYESFDVDEHIRFEYNTSDNKKTITADKNYETPNGIFCEKGATIEIRSFGSVILLMNNMLTNISEQKK